MAAYPVDAGCGDEQIDLAEVSLDPIDQLTRRLRVLQVDAERDSSPAVGPYPLSEVFGRFRASAVAESQRHAGISKRQRDRTTHPAAGTGHKRNPAAQPQQWRAHTGGDAR